MLKNIITLGFIVLIVWYFEVILEVVLPIPTETMVEGFLDLDVDWQYNIFKLLRFVVWVIALAILLKYARPLLGFVLPLSRQYSTTKPVRRLQGVVTEFLIFGFAFLVLGIFIAANPARMEYKNAIREERNRIDDNIDHSYEEKRKELKKIIKENRQNAYEFVQSKKSTINVPNGIWPLNGNKTISEYSTSEEFPVVPSIARWWSGENSDIRLNRTYRKYFDKQKEAFTLLQSNESVRVDSKAKLDKTAKAATRKKLGNPILFVIKRFKEKLWLLLASALIVYIILHFMIRSGLGKWYEKLLQFFHHGRFGRGGSARFAGIFEEWPLAFKNQENALYLGRSLFNPFRHIGLKDLRHMITIAGTRAGKGISTIITNLLLWKGSVMVIDPKGTNAVVSARQRRKIGQEVHIIDPFGITGEETASINVLSLIDPNSPTAREEIQRIAEALVIYDDNEERHWSDGAKTVIAGCCAHLITSPKYENPNLTMLRDMISMLPDKQAELWAEMSLNEGAGKLARDAANRVIRGISTDEITNILSNADKHTEWLTSPVMENVLSKNSFNFQDLKNKPTTVYLVLPPSELKNHSRFLRLFINLALNQMSIGGKAKVPVLMMIDEFLALERMQEVEKAFPLMAGYNLILWPFIQNLSGLHKIYGKEGADTFLSNSRAIQVFGVDGGSTKEFVSQHIGEVTLKGNKGRPVHLRTPSEVAIDVAAESGRQYILRAGKPPLVLEKVPYYKSAPFSFLKWIPFFKGAFRGIFHGKFDPDPDYA